MCFTFENKFCLFVFHPNKIYILGYLPQERGRANIFIAIHLFYIWSALSWSALLGLWASSGQQLFWSARKSQHFRDPPTPAPHTHKKKKKKKKEIKTDLQIPVCLPWFQQELWVVPRDCLSIDHGLNTTKCLRNLKIIKKSVHYIAET